MEAVDHGLHFVRQLISCLVRYAANTQPQQQQQQAPAAAGASLPVAAAVTPPAKHASTGAAAAADDAAGESARAAADACQAVRVLSGCQAVRVLSGRPSLDPGAVVIEMQPSDELQAGGAVADLPSRNAGNNQGCSLVRWSRVPVTAAGDSEILEEAASAGACIFLGSWREMAHHTWSLSSCCSVRV